LNFDYKSLSNNSFSLSGDRFLIAGALNNRLVGDANARGMSMDDGTVDYNNEASFIPLLRQSSFLSAFYNYVQVGRINEAIADSPFVFASGGDGDRKFFAF